MAVSNNVCRNILDTQSVVKDQISNLLSVELVSTGDVSPDRLKNIVLLISKCVDDQTSSLIDRVLNEFRKSKK
jgi:hypothetical protein